MRVALSRRNFPQARLLEAGWSLCSTPPGTVRDPSGLSKIQAQWTPLSYLTSVAAALRALGKWSLDVAPVRFDASDWWYRLSFETSEQDETDCVLGFDGLATASEVWLDGALILRSSNMFLRHTVSLADIQPGAHELLLRFQSMDELLGVRRSRPRWRTPMVENQQLRWWRTTLLGRTPGWSPPASVVGPWRPVWLARADGCLISDAVVDVALEGSVGLLSVAGRLHKPPNSAVTIRARCDGQDHAVQCAATSDGSIRCSLRLPDVRRWWPHTHGEPVLYQVTVEMGGDSVVSLGHVGFRTIEIDSRDGDFQFIVNGVKVFCRGACWTPVDSTSLSATLPDYESALAQMRDSGMNMVRVAGTIAYESDDFLDVCDRYGILVWQDLMFANMDYPHGDEGFRQSVRAEVEQVIADVRQHACLAILCGNSEVEQQAAMWGAPRELWQPELFHEFIPSILRDVAPTLPYWPSSAHGGSFPHDPAVGTTSYYGVGAYRLGPDDARRGAPRFATECLAIANVPNEGALERLPGHGAVRVHQSIWRTRSPRDLGAGWDFDDIRDHYLATRFGVDVVSLRYADHERYLQLSRATSGEVMAEAFSEWRTGSSRCRGALVLFQKDLWLGAGWGLIDARGQPKAAWYYLRRVLQPIALSVTDEGTGGLAIHVINDRPETFHGQVRLQLLRDARVVVATGRLDVMVDAHSTAQWSAAAAFDAWHDLNYAYRFGPVGHDVLVVTLLSATADAIAQSSYFPPTTNLSEADAGELDVEAEFDGNAVVLGLNSRRFLRCISLEFEGFQPEDNYFNLPPGQVRRVVLTKCESRNRLAGTVGALNLRRRKPVALDLPAS